MKKTMTIAAIAATALTMSTIDSTAASTVTLKDGQLVYSDTSKIVSGYKVYKNKLYKNGVLATGRVKYGTGANMKLYKDGTLEKGIYITSNSTYIFKDGSLIKGVYKHETNHTQDLIFKDGVLTNKIIVDNYKLYDNGKLKKGPYVISEYNTYGNDNDDRLYLFLYVDGVLAKGIQEGTYHHETLLFKDGEQSNFFYDGKVYVEGKVAPRDTHILCDDGKLYYNDALFTGTYEKFYYEDGVRAYNTIVKQYEDTLAEILALKSDIGTVPDDDISATLKAKTTELVTLVKEEKFSLYTEYGGGRDEDGEYFNSEATTRKIGGELQQIVEIAKSLNGQVHETEDLLEETLIALYEYEDLYYRNGQLLDGVVDGYVYQDGKRKGVALNLALDNAARTASIANTDLFNAMKENDQAKVEASLTHYIEASEKAVVAANTLLKEGKSPTYPNVYFNESYAKQTIRTNYENLAQVCNAANTYNVTPQLSALQQVLQEGYALLGETITLTNTTTKKTYAVKKLSKARFSSNAPNGTYEVTIKPAVSGISEHVAFRYVLSPTLKMNVVNENGYRDQYTFNAKKDTKIEFKLENSGAKEIFKIYNDKHEVVKKVTLAENQMTRTFVYTVKKGRYSIQAPMSITPKVKK